MNEIILRHYPSPCGTLLLGSLGGRLCLCEWEAARRRRLPGIPAAAFSRGSSAVLDRAAAWLDAYFAGRHPRFEGIPLLPAGTPFQQAVWAALLSVPYGATLSYGELARRIGRPAAVRAAAAGCRANPIAIFIPCHRVIGAGGALTGYAGGLPAKKFLLNLENTQQEFKL